MGTYPLLWQIRPRRNVTETILARQKLHLKHPLEHLGGLLTNKLGDNNRLTHNLIHKPGIQSSLVVRLGTLFWVLVRDSVVAGASFPLL